MDSKLLLETKRFADIINYSDLGDTWSADVLVNRSKGKFMYIPDNGIYKKINKVPEKRITPRWHTQHKADDIIFLTDAEAEEINGLLTQARDLESQAKDLRKQAKDLIGNSKINKGSGYKFH
jgi:hypothetical protein